MKDIRSTACTTSVWLWTQADQVRPSAPDRARITLSHALLRPAKQVLPYPKPQTISRGDAPGPNVQTGRILSADTESSSVEIASPLLAPITYRRHLIQGLLRRCVTPPYFTVERLWPNQEEAARTHASRIAHSFVDGGVALTRHSALESSKVHDETRRGGTLPTGEAMSRLGLGRRGAWLVPVANSLPIPHTSVSEWAAHHSGLPPDSTRVLVDPVTRSTTKNTKRGLRHDLLPTIAWTEMRVRALWSILKSLGGRTDVGQLNAKCTFRSIPVSAPQLDWPDLIRVSCDSHYALRVRSLLGLVTVAMARLGQEDDRFLLAAHLVWVDDEGDPILTAAG
ncbi:BQ2448_5743 [Microbotryum intermedium]|uniref:BQ2448_5743 protein n=1 Tax=Microbotryum intermedium TaxID=269621 RepID=A0A238F233_9BASI|nr:BQ2448_5743 [Microbotryum intermedium]